MKLHTVSKITHCALIVKKFPSVNFFLTNVATDASDKYQVCCYDDDNHADYYADDWDHYGTC